MSGDTIGRLFQVTTCGESHGPALACIISGCPPGLEVCEADIQIDLERRRTGKSRHTTQRREPDQVQILSGVFEGLTTGVPIGLIIHNQDQRSKDYSEIRDRYRPGHADFTYDVKYGIRDYRCGGLSSARETASRVAAGGVARAALAKLVPGLTITGYMVGKDYEQGGMIKHGAKMIQAVSNVRVPKLSLYLGASFGAGNYGMCGQGYDPDFVFSWPNIQIGVMGGEQAARTMSEVFRASAARKGNEVDEDMLAQQEARVIDYKRFAAEAFAHTNGIDRRVWGRPGAKIGFRQRHRERLPTADPFWLCGRTGFDLKD
mgnify:CR=1 FL=1